MSISIASAAVTVTGAVSGIRYIHDFVTNITITNSKTNNLTVSPQGGGKGIIYRTGLTTPITCEMIVRGMPNELVDFYKTAYDKEERFHIMVVDSRTNERYDLNNSIIGSDPRSMNSSEGEQSLDQALNFEAPPSGFTHVNPTSFP